MEKATLIDKLAKPASTGLETGIGSTKSIPYCKKVTIAGELKRIPFGAVVSGASTLGDARIAIANPSPCEIAVHTKIEFVESCNYEVREGNTNMIIYERCGDKTRVMPYPKEVWKEVWKFYIEPLAKGGRPENIGLLLVGPPGTGKSNLAEVMAKILGIDFKVINTSILSKYVGESEKNLEKAIKEAREYQPSILLFDDAEWMLSARDLSGTEGVYRTTLNLQQILLREMQVSYNRGDKVLFIATTNVKVDALDQALIRPGRFGNPVFVPIPDYEAAKIILQHNLSEKSSEEIDKLAKMAVSLSFSVADIIDMINRVKRGEPPRPYARPGKGYKRIYADPLGDFDNVEDLIRFPLCKLENARLWMPMEPDLALAIATQLFTACKKSIVYINDPDNFKEAIYMANLLKSVLVMPSFFHELIQYYAHENTETTILFVGEKKPFVAAMPFLTFEYAVRTLRVKRVLKAVLSYKNLKYSDKTIERVSDEISDNPERAKKVFQLILTTGIKSEDDLEKILAWMI